MCRYCQSGSATHDACWMEFVRRHRGGLCTRCGAKKGDDTKIRDWCDGCYTMPGLPPWVGYPGGP